MEHGINVVRQTISVLLVFVLLGTALCLLRKGRAASTARASRFRCLLRLTPGRAKSLEPVERLALTPQHSIHLVRIHGRELLVATHPRGCTVLNESSRGARV